jgi:hypothetical protein
MPCNPRLDVLDETSANSPMRARVLRMTVLAALLAVAAAAPLVAAAQSGACGSLANAYGPYDFRTDKDKLGIVEKHHFATQQELLIRGRSEAGVSLGGNIDYTLRAFPNHHRALLSMSRLGEKLKLPKVPGADHSVDCYFVRATQFAPDDHIVRLLFAHHLARQGRKDEGLGQVDAAKALAGDNAFSHYNVGLAYLELGNMDAALEQAHRAQSMGFTRPDLMDRLKAANRWREPLPEVSKPPTSAPVASEPKASGPAS